MIGQLLIITGIYLLLTVFRGKAAAILDAITGNSGFSANLDGLASAIGPLGSSGGGGGGSSGRASGSGNAPDSGSHMGIDSSGNIVTIDKPYGSMTDSEKDAANNYAHQIGNVG